MTQKDILFPEVMNMETNEITEVVFVLDASGSMKGKEKDTINGYNSFVEEEKGEKGRCYLTAYLFSSQVRRIVDHEEIHEAREMSEDVYRVGGMTALLDAIGTAVFETENRVKETKRKVIMAIITDGMENASREYTYPMIKSEIERKKKEGWKFLFLASNIDVPEVAAHLGIEKEDCDQYEFTEDAVRANYRRMAKAVSMFRMKGTLDEDWKKE